MMRHYLDIAYEEALATENELKKFFRKQYNAVQKENVANGLGSFLTFAEWHKLETCDKYGTPVPVQCGDNNIWLSTVWVASTNIPKGVELNDGRVPVKAVSMWYTPRHENIDVLEWFDRAEKEKILFQDTDIKISQIRRNVIPNAHSCQWHHKMSKPEYALFYRYYRPNTKGDLIFYETQDNALKKIMLNGTYSKEEARRLSDPIIAAKKKHYESKIVWLECAHANTLRDLIRVAKQSFNDWYVK